MTKQPISPNDMLSAGTKINYPGYLGEVVSYEVKKDQNNYPITVHTIKLTHKFERKQGRDYIVALPEKKQRVFPCNYASIYLVNA